MNQSELVLASSSDIRKKIISKYDFPFIIAKHKFDEESFKLTANLNPKDLSLHLAKQKALSLSNDYDNLILGCDQICLMNNEIFNKPLTKEKAIQNLTKLAGKTHELIGSYVFIKQGNTILSETIISKMTMKNLTEKDIMDYVMLDKPLQSCGSYMFEKNGYTLFTEITGSLEAINGLPFRYLMDKLKQCIE
ncbi:MAG: septum formation protein Maf [Gammaproteobacteria bacterium TMED112]|nr:MAG: septum formation protein Maf [Gammaproteobacteria bacterium TMED112]